MESPPVKSYRFLLLGCWLEMVCFYDNGVSYGFGFMVIFPRSGCTLKSMAMDWDCFLKQSYEWKSEWSFIIFQITCLSPVPLGAIECEVKIVLLNTVFETKRFCVFWIYPWTGEPVRSAFLPRYCDAYLWTRWHTWVGNCNVHRLARKQLSAHG